MKLIQQAATINEAPEPTNAHEVVEALSHALVGKKITAFGPKGKGLWGDHHEVQTYRIKRLVPHILKDDSDYVDYANLDVYLDGYHAGGVKGKDAHGNHTILGGLIYTDKTFIAHLKQLLVGVPAMKFVKYIGYSEQGMQGDKYVNLDIEFKKFPKKVDESKEQKHEHKVGDDIEWDEEDGDAENGPTGHLSTCSGTVKKLHPKGYEVERHDDGKEFLVHHKWASKMQPRGEEVNEAKQPKFKVGEKVLWRGSFGNDAQKKVTIVDNSDEKNGRIVYDLDNDHWAYEHQLSKIAS